MESAMVAPAAKQSPSPSADPRNLLEDLVQRARKAGADAADAVLFDSASLSLSQRLGNPEKLEREESRDLGLRVFVVERRHGLSLRRAGCAGAAIRRPGAAPSHGHG